MNAPDLTSGPAKLRVDEAPGGYQIDTAIWKEDVGGAYLDEDGDIWFIRTEDSKHGRQFGPCVERDQIEDLIQALELVIQDD